MNKFKPGQTLTAGSIGDRECIYTATVIKRTAKMVTIMEHGRQKTVKIHNDGFVGEYYFPHGHHSMCAIFRAPAGKVEPVTDDAPEEIITRGGPERGYKMCRRSQCGIEELCTPVRDFYTLGNQPDALLCETCFDKLAVEVLDKRVTRPQPGTVRRVLRKEAEEAQVNFNHK